jgi:hypothetical protein
MQLHLESGRVFARATEEDILPHVDCEVFAILSVSPDTYLQCAIHDERPGEFVLEFQDGSLDRHYRAADKSVARHRILSAFLKYLHGDESWRSDFAWEKQDIS